MIDAMTSLISLCFFFNTIFMAFNYLLKISFIKNKDHKSFNLRASNNIFYEC